MEVLSREGLWNKLSATSGSPPHTKQQKHHQIAAASFDEYERLFGKEEDIYTHFDLTDEGEPDELKDRADPDDNDDGLESDDEYEAEMQAFLEKTAPTPRISNRCTDADGFDIEDDEKHEPDSEKSRSICHKDSLVQNKLTVSPENHAATNKTDAGEAEQNNQPTALIQATVAADNFTLKRHEPLERESFPDAPKSKKCKVPATITNIVHLLDKYHISVRYNVIKKSSEIIVPGLSCSLDNADNVALTQIKNLAVLNDVSTQSVDEILLAIADSNPYNPVADWIMSKKWDGVDRLEDLYSTLQEAEGYPTQLKKILMFRWLLSAVAAVFMPRGFKSRGVLTIQGPQLLGKTSWIAALITCPILRETVIKLDQHMDAGDKDAKITALLHWIVEIGELDSSFKKDIARLKGFITSDSDKIRVPYAKAPSNFPRRTVFCATVNDTNFLVDSTGNSRWWTISVDKVTYKHDIDMQQLWAQVKTEYDGGEQWWLMPEEDTELEAYNDMNHRSISAIEEQLLPSLDLNRIGKKGLEALTASEVLNKIGFKHVKNGQARECGTILRKLLGSPKKIKGIHKWYVPFAETFYQH